MRGRQVQTRERKISHCHKDVAKVAKGLCAASYEMCMGGSNLVYKEWKRQNPQIAENPKRLLLAFVNRNWGKYIPAARATMARLLTSPIDESAKERIMEALTLDATLIRGRVNPAILAGTVAPKT